LAFRHPPPFSYDVIVADPPPPARTRADPHYDVMALGDIKALPVGQTNMFHQRQSIAYNGWPASTVRPAVPTAAIEMAPSMFSNRSIHGSSSKRASCSIFAGSQSSRGSVNDRPPHLHSGKVFRLCRCRQCAVLLVRPQNSWRCRASRLVLRGRSETVVMRC
jgi:hypothetical protein